MEKEEKRKLMLTTSLSAISRKSQIFIFPKSDEHFYVNKKRCRYSLLIISLEAVHAAVKAEIEAKMDSSLVKTEPKYSRSRSRSGSRSTRKSRSRYKLEFEKENIRIFDLLRNNFLSFQSI